MQHDIQVLQIQNLDKDEFVSIINKAIETKFQMIKDDSKPNNYSVQTVSKLIKCSDLTTYKLIRTGVLPASRIGRKYIIRRVDLERVLKEVKSIRYRR